MIKALAVLSGTKKTKRQSALAKASKHCSVQLKNGKITSFTTCVKQQLKGKR